MSTGTAKHRAASSSRGSGPFWLCLLLIVAGVVYPADPTGWLGSDDSAYFNAAEQILHGQTIQRVHHHPSRLSAILPVTVSLGIFGSHVFAVILPALISALGCLTLTAYLGRLLWGWPQGLLAAAFVAGTPYFRTLATTAYPDIYVCLYATASLVCAFRAYQSADRSPRWWWALASAVAVGLAASAKIVAIALLIPVAVIVCANPPLRSRDKLLTLGGLTAGCLVFFVAHGLLSAYLTGDFWFKLRALQLAEQFDPSLSHRRVESLGDYAALAAYRLAMPFRFGESGWGVWGVLFWPAMLSTIWMGRRARLLAFAAAILFSILSLVPVKFSSGLYPFVFFNGRHALFLMIPFALIAGRLLMSLAARIADQEWAARWAPISAILLLACGRFGPQGVEGFKNRPLRRIGVAIQEVAAAIPLSEHRPIFMPASLYLRYRILFPARLRERLRVAVDEQSPNWWRDATADVAKRRETLPPPSEALLLATPKQMRGEAEDWDYGVTLPRVDLRAWSDFRSSCSTIAEDQHKLLLLWGTKSEGVAASAPRESKSEASPAPRLASTPVSPKRDD